MSNTEASCLRSHLVYALSNVHKVMYLFLILLGGWSAYSSKHLCQRCNVNLPDGHHNVVIAKIQADAN